MKDAGMWIIAASVMGLGCAAAEAAADRYRALRQVENMLTLISDEIRCSFSPFYQVFRSLAKRLDEPWKEFLEKMAEELDAFSGKSFYQIWQDGVDGLPKNCGLAASDRGELKALGKGLGYLDAQVQMDAIRHFLLGWEQRTEDVRMDLKNKQRMYRCLGAASGLVILILLM